MTAAKTVGATFTIQRFTLTVATPPVNGTITRVTGIICDPAGTDCTETYDYNTAVVLTATPAVGHDFAAWSGDCIRGRTVHPGDDGQRGRGRRSRSSASPSP